MSGSITNRVSRLGVAKSEIELGAGPRVCVVQHIQVCGAADGAEYGM